MTSNQTDWLAPVEDRAADQKTIAERQWRAPLKPSAEQRACEHGLFSDDAQQVDLIDLLRQPAARQGRIT